MSKVYDLKLKYDSEGGANLIFKNGGFALDESLFTDINALIFTDDYSQDYAINKRRGQINIDFANELWTVINHARLNEDTRTKITYILNQILDKFIEAGCWTSHSIEIENETNSGFDIRITTMNSASNEQNIYYIPYNKIWSENEI